MNKDTTFAVGQVVWLKSGSPALTVTKNDPDGNGVWVTWIEGLAVQSGYFPGACLTDERPEAHLLPKVTYMEPPA